MAANTAAEDALGLTWEQMIGRTSGDPRWAAVSEDGRPLMGEEHPAMLALTTGRPVLGVLMGVLLPPGPSGPAETRWLLVDAEPLVAGGRILGVLAQFTVDSDSPRARSAGDALLGSYRLLSNAAPGVVLSVDTDGIVRNYSGSPMTGAAEPLGRSVRDYLSGDDADTVMEGLLAAIHAQEPIRVDCRWAIGPDEPRWVTIHAQPLRGDDFAGALLAVHDVDEAVRARQRLDDLGGELDRERLRLKRAMAAAQLGAWEWDGTTGVVQFDDRLGEILGRPDLVTLPPDGWRDLVDSQDLASVIDPAPKIRDGATDQFDIVVRMIHRDGRRLWVRVRGEETSRRDDGGATVSGTLEDVTERVETQRALAHSEAHYRLLAEHVTDAVWQVSPTGVVLWASDSTEGLLGWTPEQVVGTEALSFLHPDDLDRGRRGREPSGSGRAVTDQAAMRCADGAYRMVSISVRPVPRPEGTSEILAFRDIQGEVDARNEADRIARHDPLTGLPTGLPRSRS